MRKLFLPAICGTVLLFAACSDESTDNPEVPAETTKTNFTVTIENVAPEKAFVESGVFNTPVGETEPGPVTSGKKYEFTVNAGRSQHLSFATMLAATNDLFYGPDDAGIALYDDDGEPISGNVTDQVYLWDAGTEMNEEPAVGPNTVTNQTAPNTGVEENGNVIDIGDVTGGFDFDYPEVKDVITVTVEHIEGTEFKVTIAGCNKPILKTSEGDVPAPLSPGVWVVHGGENPLYTVGMPDLGQGIEGIAEDGDPTALGEYVAANTGVTYPASPGGWLVHAQDTKPLFTEGMKDYGIGIEEIAEDGSAMVLGENVASLDGYLDGAVFNTPVGNDSPGPILPGSKYEFSFEAEAGDNLSFATMLAATNDIFFAPEDIGISLFGTDGAPLSGDITDMVYLWDAGTEVNERPAIGLNTVTNQLAPDTGMDEDGTTLLLSDVDDGYEYPTVAETIKVTITAN